MIEIIGVIFMVLLICMLEAVGEIRHREYYYVKQYEIPKIVRINTTTDPPPTPPPKQPCVICSKCGMTNERR